MNSQTWLVEHQGSVSVAKRVAPADVDALVAGCRVAETLSDVGFVTGRPIRTIDGRLAVGEGRLALLEHVPGRELDGDTDEEQGWIAETLAGVHAASEPVPGPGTAGFFTGWLSPELPGVSTHPWLCQVVETVRAETDPLIVTWCGLHTDPSPEAFIHDDSTGTTGLVDWAGATRGPVLSDVASTVMYLGGPEGASAFLAAYESAGPLDREELQLLDAFRRFRWAVQGAYFAWRLAMGDLTGISNQGGNEKGLHDARTGLTELGLETG